MDTVLQEQINTAINYRDVPMALEVLGLIKKGQASEVDHLTVLQLQYIRMKSMSERQLLSLLSSSILAAYTIPEFDLDDELQDYFDQLADPALEISVREEIISILEKSQEPIGSDSIAVRGIAVKPFIGNWISDYGDHPAHEGTKDAFTEMQYFNTSANVRKLSTEEKGIMQNVFQLYDHCRQAVAIWENIVIPKNPDEALKDFDAYELIPGLEDELAEERSRKQSNGVTTAQTPTPRPSPKPVTGNILDGMVQPTYVQPKSVSSQPTNRPSVEQFPPQPINQPPTREQQELLQRIAAQSPARMHSVDGAQVKNLINMRAVKPGGIVLNQKTNIELDKEKVRLDKAREKTTIDIQEKLEDLRKRNKKS